MQNFNRQPRIYFTCDTCGEILTEEAHCKLIREKTETVGLGVAVHERRSTTGEKCGGKSFRSHYGGEPEKRDEITEYLHDGFVLPTIGRPELKAQRLTARSYH